MSQVRNSVQKQITKFGSVLGSLVANKKKPAKKKESSQKMVKKVKQVGLLSTQGYRSGLVAPPTNFGVSSAQGGTRHTPFIISGIGTLCSIAGTNGGSVQLYNANDALSATNRFSLDPAGGGTTASNFLCLQSAIRGVCLSFVRYRWRRFKVTYVPVVPTSTGGSIVVGFSPEVITTGTTANQALEISSFERNFSTPVWAPLTYDAIGHDGIDQEWYYVDPSSPIDESNLRQESAGSLFVGILGHPLTNTTFGVLRVEYSIELEGLANTGLFTLSQPKTELEEVSASTQGSHTPASSLTGQHSLRPPSPEPEYYPVPVGGRRYIPTV